MLDSGDPMALIPPFDELITEAEIERLRALHAHHGRVHPLVSVALHPGRPQNPGQIAINTCIALRSVLDRFPDWVQSLRPRLLDENDWSSAESAIAEIRACGDLLRAGFPVELGGKNAASGAKAEFHVTIDNSVTIVEVWNRNLGKTQTATTASGTPFGQPNPDKEGDSVLTNVIQRVAAIKEREHQANERNPFVVWADLQSVETMRFDFKEHLLPLMSWNGALESGGYWHALYGRKGDVVAEMGSGQTRINHMRHDGRYSQTMKHGGPTRISVFIFSSPEATAMLENPAASNPIDPAFRRFSVDLPRFEIGLSLMNWSEGLVARTVAVQRDMIVGVLRTMGLVS